MSVTPSQTTGWSPIGSTTQLPPGGDSDPQSSTVQIGEGQSAFFDATTGKVALNDGATPHLVCAGVGADRLTGTGSSVRLWTGYGTGQPSITGAGDAIGAGDQLVPVFDSGNGVPGKLSNLSGSDRSFMGLNLGLNDLGYPIIWAGPVASAVGRSVHQLNNASAGQVAYPVDGGATVDFGSTSAATAAIIIPRSKTHGVITSIEIIPSAALSATSGNDRTITIWKLDTLGGASPVSVGTFVTTTALVAQTRALFTLSAVAGALNLLETDILAYSTVHASSGAVIPSSAIRANMKVI